MSSGAKGFVEMIAQLRRISSGEFARDVQEEVLGELRKLAEEPWNERRSPTGVPWTGARGRPLSLQKSGSLKSSEQVHKDGLGGVKAEIDGPHYGRHTLASIMQYGGHLRAKRQGFYRGKAKTVGWRKEMQGRAIGAGEAHVAGASKPMRFMVGGRWISRYSVHISANKMLPDPGTMPVRWDARLREAVARAISRLGKKS